MKFAIQNHAFWKSTKNANMSFSRNEKNQNVIFWLQTFFQNLICRKVFNSKSNAYFFQSKIWRVVKPLNQNLTRCEILVSKSDALENFNSKSDKFENFFPEIWFYLVFQILTEWWYLLTTLIPTYFKEENQKTMRVIVSCQMDNWKLPHVNSTLNVWGIALWQHTIFTEVTNRTVWSIKHSRSAVFLKIHLCENERKRSLYRLPSIFSNVFVWATRRRAMERSWHLHSMYPILAAGRYLPQSWHLFSAM